MFPFFRPSATPILVPTCRPFLLPFSSFIIGQMPFFFSFRGSPFFLWLSERTLVALLGFFPFLKGGQAIFFPFWSHVAFISRRSFSPFFFFFYLPCLIPGTCFLF